MSITYQIPEAKKVMVFTSPDNASYEFFVFVVTADTVKKAQNILDEKHGEGWTLCECQDPIPPYDALVLEETLYADKDIFFFDGYAG